MKKITLFMLLGIFLFSCEEEEPAKPLCEMIKTGTVTLKNFKSYSIYVEINRDKKLLGPSGTGTWESLPAGTCTLAITDSGNVFSSLSFPSGNCLDACEKIEMTYGK